MLLNSSLVKTGFFKCRSQYQSSLAKILGSLSDDRFLQPDWRPSNVKQYSFTVGCANKSVGGLASRLLTISSKITCLFIYFFQKRISAVESKLESLLFVLIFNIAWVLSQLKTEPKFVCPTGIRGAFGSSVNLKSSIVSHPFRKCIIKHNSFAIIYANSWFLRSCPLVW